MYMANSSNVYYVIWFITIYSQTCIKRTMKNWHYKTVDILERGSIDMKFSLTREEKSNLLKQVTTY